MTYSPYLIANFATGVDKKLQPWLSPDDAQLELYDGYVYRGTMSKRDGYNYFATGVDAGLPYRESRIVRTLSSVAPSTGVINGVNRTFTFVGTAQTARGSVTITGNNPAQVVTDTGLNGPLNLQGAGTGTVNYLTGAITVTFTLAPAIASTVLLTYSYMPANPVMMIASFYTATNIRELIVADTQYVNRYNSTTDVLDYLPAAITYTGTNKNFFSWVNYQNAAGANRLLFTNNVNPIQVYDGATVANYVPTLTGVAALTCLQMFEFKDRLILLRTTEDGVIHPRRIRISGTGANSDVFDTTATGAGSIEIPDNTWIMGAAFNRDDLIIFTQGSTWTMKYTGNDTTPFVLDRIDESRGSQAPFSTITYLNRTTTASPRGLIITDGYRVEREDDNIPDFTFDEIDGQNFDLCFAGTVDDDQDHYLLYPPPNQSESKRILVTNYDEDNFAIYRLPMSCMGSYITAFDITWNSLLAYPNWDAFAAAYGNWNSFAYSQGAPITIGGGHKGEIWQVGDIESEDNIVKIRNITVVDATTIEVTTDWNNFSLHEDDTSMGADYIFLTGVLGMQEVNDQQYAIKSVTNNNVFRLNVPDSSTFTAYTSGGEAYRVIPFSSLMKQFNPYINDDKKVRCGWLYMYVNSTGTSLKRNIQVSGATQADPCVITTQVNHGLQTGNQVTMFGLGGMTELNGNQYFITVVTPTTFSLDGVDSSAYTAYTSGGYASVAENAKIGIDVFTNDRENPYKTVPNYPNQGNCTNLSFENGVKKWYKVYINQVGRFIQFRIHNTQAGAKIKVQAIMPGFQSLGRIL